MITQRRLPPAPRDRYIALRDLPGIPRAVLVPLRFRLGKVPRADPSTTHMRKSFAAPHDRNTAVMLFRNRKPASIPR
jgi:hypothetical protein